ncbi:MAG: enoyl-CoA hydratase [Pseudomonadales bacterium]|jgi:enoyl-CoA hydratase/carnithine racemase|nr:enoyl-CoA hydratase [Pseudomonadales bacterium]MDP6470569.1 enoyl-CoA hydratase [Pseudomonadales bacterium]MDP6827871.1 enoyl-CoA hydratase [Pseudomonadales bacterium]MDP6970540.1 enoyl-CoA hydratase [Pseudomonadales bacterium]|tara:strand:+ start:721 stop:1524 length:804 start_codon:yes stop_codon:yes gene_type:complete
MKTLELKTKRMLAHSENGIGWMIFNNPARHNALSLEMWQGMAGVMTAFAEDDDVRVVILRGAGGKAFVSGADISEFDDKRGSADQKAEYGRIAGAGSRALATFDKPVIGLIEGFCIGGGLATALSADIRFATPDSRFGIPAARLGLGYEYEGLAKLIRLVGPSRARDIMLSARFMDATEALDMGLINFIAERDTIEARVLDYAKTIAGNAPLTVKAAKAAVNVWERGAREDQIAAVEALVNACFDSNDYKEGRRAFKEKRTPDFEGH